MTDNKGQHRLGSERGTYRPLGCGSHEAMVMAYVHRVEPCRPSSRSRSAGSRVSKVKLAAQPRREVKLVALRASSATWSRRPASTR
jgi:hypothetical protein